MDVEVSGEGQDVVLRTRRRAAQLDVVRARRGLDQDGAEEAQGTRGCAGVENGIEGLLEYTNTQTIMVNSAA